MTTKQAQLSQWGCHHRRTRANRGSQVPIDASQVRSCLSLYPSIVAHDSGTCASRMYVGLDDFRPGRWREDVYGGRPLVTPRTAFASIQRLLPNVSLVELA